ncbi:MAG TPA: entericidin A/B family lipoprotein [Azospirillum sp.]|nr:entericidin A/B family lipoprotein [Azospirillum sp.]
MKAILVLVVSITAAALLAGCNTIQGVGQDIKAGGAAIERAAGKTK